MTQLALNFSQAARARDAGIARAVEHTGEDWFEPALTDLVRFVRERGEATIEQFRFDWLSRGHPSPASHKAWGALAITAARRGLIANTGRYVKARAERTHGHPVPLWRAT